MGSTRSAARVGMDKKGSVRSFLILGGTGNVGKHVVLALAQCTEVPAKVYVGTRQPDIFKLCKPSGSQVVVEPVECNLSCPKSSLAPREMETVSNAVVDAAKMSGAKRLVRVSSLGIDGDVGQGALGAAHVACEAHCHAAGLPLTSIRPTSFHTNFLTYDAESLRKENCFRSPLGKESKVNWVDCQDIGQARWQQCFCRRRKHLGEAMRCLRCPPEATLSAPEMASLLSEELGRSIQYIEVTPPPAPEYAELWAFLRSGGFDCSTGTVEELTGKPPIDFRSIVRANKTMLGCKL